MLLSELLINFNNKEIITGSAAITTYQTKLEKLTEINDESIATIEQLQISDN